MDPLSLIAGPLLGMGVGAIKDLADAPNRQRKLQLAADTQRLSPWTGLQGKMPEQRNVFNDVLQGGMAGLQVGQGLSKMSAGNAPQIGPPTQAQASAATGGKWADLVGKAGKAFT